MTVPDRACAAGPAARAVLARVRTQLSRITDPVPVIGIRTDPHWAGDTQVQLDGHTVRVVACPSVLAVLDALATAGADSVTVVLTLLPDSELGDAVLARLHRGTLLEADRNTLLADVLGTRGLDPRIRASSWLVDALIALAAANALPPTAGSTLGLARAVGLVVTARLGLDPELADVPALVAAFDDTARRSAWRALPETERRGLVDHLRERHGPGASVIARLAEGRDDVLAELLVAQALTAAPEQDPRAAAALGGFTQSRFGPSASTGPRPSRVDLAAAGAAAVAHVPDAATVRLGGQIRRAGEVLAELDAIELAMHSPVLPRGFTERLARAAQTLDPVDLQSVCEHRDAGPQQHRIERVRAAVRLHRWLATSPEPHFDTAAAGVAAHARELARVDRALAQLRAGDPDPRVGAVLDGAARRAATVRGAFDRAFATRLAAAPETPDVALAVESFLPSVVAPLAASVPVLLVVVDGMSGAVAGDLVDRLTDHRTGWSEIIRTAAGEREAVLAAFPTETRYSRTSLFCAALRAGDQSVERSVFPTHRFWPAAGAHLHHKSGVAGRDGADLGPDLEESLRPGAGPAVVAVVLNAVDDALGKGRAATDTTWRPEDVTGLPQLLERAVVGGRAVVLTGDHGHVLEHGSTARRAEGGGSRWRPAGGEVEPDELLLAGPRVLTPDGRAIMLTTDQVRYGARAGGGYHGGATLAEAAIPLLVLMPPGVEAPDGWTVAAAAEPGWWSGIVPSDRSPAPGPVRRDRRAPDFAPADGLFELPGAPEAAPSRGAQLVGSAAFRAAHAEMPANRVPTPAVFSRVVDALVTAGGRVPIAAVAAVAGAAGRNPRGLVSVMGRVLNRDSYPVLTLVDGDATASLDLALLDEQFPR